MRPPSAPIRSEAKNSPPRKPVPSVTIAASDLSTRRSAMADSGAASADEMCSAPWPDDSTSGVRIAIEPTKRPPRVGRSTGRTRSQSSANSQAATPRISRMPSLAAAIPTSTETARSVWLR
jgi:hypothetical protein